MQAERTCIVCGSIFYSGRWNAAKCSDACRAAHKQAYNAAYVVQHYDELRARDRARRGPRLQRYCEECSVPLPLTGDRDRRFCSRRCINVKAARERPGVKRMATRRYRARKRGNESAVVSERDWLRLVERYRHCCAYCGKRRTLTMDHVIPLSRGGRHAIGNLLPACWPCNRDKHARTVMEWRLGRRIARSVD